MGDVAAATDQIHDETGMFPAVYFFVTAGRNKHYKISRCFLADIRAR
jgi:uncharacterized protein YrrD